MVWKLQHPARTPARSSFLDQALDLSRVNWEVVAFGVLLIITLGTRFWDLGSRAMHHDKSIHALLFVLAVRGQPGTAGTHGHRPQRGL